jgi:hypothetical protein
MNPVDDQVLCSGLLIVICSICLCYIPFIRVVELTKNLSIVQLLKELFLCPFTLTVKP